MKEIQNEQQIVSIEVLAKIAYLPDIVEFVGKLVVRLGLNKQESLELQLVTEETCLNVIEHAFDPSFCR